MGNTLSDTLQLKGLIIVQFIKIILTFLKNLPSYEIYCLVEDFLNIQKYLFSNKSIWICIFNIEIILQNTGWNIVHDHETGYGHTLVLFINKLGRPSQKNYRKVFWPNFLDFLSNPLTWSIFELEKSALQKNFIRISPGIDWDGYFYTWDGKR